MTPDTAITLLVGGGMPFVIALINQAHWSPKVRAVMAALLCCVCAVILCWWRGELNWTDWRATVVAVLGAALFAYQTFWKPSTIAPSVEAATTITGPAAVNRTVDQ